MLACAQTSFLPGEPETPTAPTTSLPALIGSPPASASTRVYCREPTVSGLSAKRLTKSAEGWLNERAVKALRSLPSGVFRPAPSPRSMTRETGAVDHRHRDFKPHAFALRERGIGDGLRQCQRNVLLRDDALRAGRRRQHGGNGETRESLRNR